jgi:S-DNA-T family DNA segregation ATPase FtsK/SpoIIIE
MSAPAARRPKAAPPRAATATRAKPIHLELLGLGLVTLGVVLMIATFYHGPVQDVLLRGVQWLFGTWGAWGVAAVLLLLGGAMLVRLAAVEVPSTSVGIGILFWAAIALVQLAQRPVWDFATLSHSPGGLLGGALAGALYLCLHQLAWVVLSAMALGGLALMTDLPLWKLLLAPFRGAVLLGRVIGRPLRARLRANREAARAARVLALQEEEARRRNRPEPEGDEAPPPAPALRVPITEVTGPSNPPKPVVLPKLTLPKFERPAPASVPKPMVVDELEDEDEDELPLVGVPSPKRKGQLKFDDRDLGSPDARQYTLPPTDLLTLPPKVAKTNKDDVSKMSAALEQTLASFGIEAKVVGVEQGPRVTRFELVPPPGIRINRITNLADDIALCLSAQDIRVEAPVPGKGVVGIEVPNTEPVLVTMRELVEAEPFRKGKSPLTVVLGRDIAGHPRVADLTRMPHLLIAGATNSGKSVCINTLICSILMRATPQQVKFLMVDPKRVELSLFQAIPHLIAPVAYDAKHAAGLLRWAIREMEERYQMFAEKGVRNIVGFNEHSRLEGLEEIPYILIIIDELADLMMQAAAEFEASICRIAQLARATGIHLVVATQRPSVNVITGTIKANIPSRIAFAVASQVDSRTILDMNGAERLVGQGDMLFLPVDASKPVRIQGAYVSESEINRVVEHVKQQGRPHFTDEIVALDEAANEDEDGENGGGGEEPEDEFFAKALDYVRTTKYASTSMLQRKFRIGYTRAARLMDKFEELGYVGPGQGSKPREVIFAPAASVVGAHTSSGGTNEAGDDGIRNPFADDEE